MNTNRTTRFAGLLTAVLMTVVINGAMLLKFDSVAQEGAFASGSQSPAIVSLKSVNIVAARQS
jgi:hypothetical protein